jgi:hypothetical protein
VLYWIIEKLDLRTLNVKSFWKDLILNWTDVILIVVYHQNYFIMDLFQQQDFLVFNTYL